MIHRDTIQRSESSLIFYSWGPFLSDPDSEHIARFLLNEIKHINDEEATASLMAASIEQRTAAAELVLQSIIDEMTDYELDHREHAFREACDAARIRLAGTADQHTPRIEALLSFICINVALLDARFSSPAYSRKFDTFIYCKKIFAETPVREAVHALYAPSRTSVAAGSGLSQVAVEQSAWENIDLGRAEYYKSGTTSFILKCQSLRPRDESGIHSEYVLKCVLFPWNKMAAISKATDNYAMEYGGANTPAEVVVQPFASTARWVLMPFQDGPTLNESLLSFENKEPSARDRIEKTRAIGLLLIDALDQLANGEAVSEERVNRQHLDLSPNNIILTPRSHQLKFIDLGPNNLYSRQVGIIEHDDSAYVAPEIKNRGKSPVADVYSLGIILIRIMCGYAPRDGRVPDLIWDISPSLARFLEDLVDEDHKKRLLLVKPNAEEPFSYGPLKSFFIYTVRLVTAEPEVSTTSKGRWLVRLLPSSRGLSAQCKRWLLSRQPHEGSNGQESYLLFFTLWATFCWWFIFSRTALYSIGGLVTLQFHRPPRGVLLAADIICFNQGLIAAKYYSAVLGQLTVRKIPGMLARTTEIAIRSMAFIALPITVLSVIWKPWLWAWSIAIGSLLVVLANWLMLTLAERIYRAGRKGNLSVVPADAKLRARGFEQWWWTMLLYAFVLGVIALGLQVHWMRDTGAYVFGLTLISIGIHYLSKFVVAGSAVRGGLARAFCAAERINILSQREPLDADFWPPRLINRQSRELSGEVRAEFKSFLSPDVSQ